MTRGSSRRDYRSGGGTLDAHGLGDRPEEAQTSRTELSGRRVLTQEFVVGVKISEVDAMRHAGLDVAQVGEAALRAAIKMLLIDGFFHTDPHPGNLFVSLDTGVVTFLDCGMVGELTV